MLVSVLKSLASFSLLGIALSVVACADVAPWQRAKLAEPTMAPDDAESVGRLHAEAVHEGAVGGNPGATSGCGCN